MANVQGLSSIQIKNSNSNALQNGSSVFVRVLSQGAKNEYIVSFAGNKYSVVSQRMLQTGTAFRASVEIKNGQVFLTPQLSTNQNTIQKFSASSQETLGSLQNFLQDLGLKPDAISLRIVQYFQANGMNFNMKLAQKSRSIGLQFPGKEDEAAEVALFLEQRGIQADVDSVMKLLGVLYGDNSQGNNFFSNGSNEHKNGSETGEENTDAGDTEAEIESFENDTKEIFSSLYSNAFDMFDRETGLLTVVNHTYTQPRHWIILPFEYGEIDHKITGSMRILIDFEKKTTENIVIFAFFAGENFKFVVKCLNKGDAKKLQYAIQFCTSKIETEQSTKYLCSMLESCLPKDLNYIVSLSNELANDGIFTLDSRISVVNLDA